MIKKYNFFLPSVFIFKKRATSWEKVTNIYFIIYNKYFCHPLEEKNL